MSTAEEKIAHYTKNFDVTSIVNLDDWYNFPPTERPTWLHRIIETLYKQEFSQSERLLFTLSQGDEYEEGSADNAGLIMINLTRLLNDIDISNFFVIVIAKYDPDLYQSTSWTSTHSLDPVPITFDWWGEADTNHKKRMAKRNDTGYSYNSRMPVKIKFEDLSEREKFLLLESKNFCIYPWLHLYVQPSGDALPCCGTVHQQGAIGNTNQSSLRELWNNKHMTALRRNMLEDKPSDGCSRCYEHEQFGVFSMRHSANKHHGHHIWRIKDTQPDGTLSKFEMVYWDVRFNNLCNLRCRSCGPSYSSSWYQDQLALAPDYGQNHKALLFAGKYETDLWEQLVEHIDHVEQIYFAGGEPLLMDEHYRILEELEKRGRFDVRLIYNTNFTETKLKNRYVFDYWKKFKSVSVGASLDAMDERAEFLRKGTMWHQIEENRRKMIEICPKVDFYVSATLSILNAWHLPDFHRRWTDLGLIKARDFNINLLIDPAHYRLDIANAKFKEIIKAKYRDHLCWLSPQDDLRRASNGYQSALNFMMGIDNTHLIRDFWRKTDQLDKIRNERSLDILPELEYLL